MRLSEAIRLGSLAIQNPRGGSVRQCAIGMGCEAIGVERHYAQIAKAWPWTLATAWGSRAALYRSMGGETDAIAKMLSYTYMGAITHTFDAEVYPGEMTLEQLCDLVTEWERECESRGINVEQVTMIATQEATHEPAAEQSEMVGVTEARDHESV